MPVGTNYAFYSYGGAFGDPEGRHPIYDSEDLTTFRQGLEDDLRAEDQGFPRGGL